MLLVVAGCSDDELDTPPATTTTTAAAVTSPTTSTTLAAATPEAAIGPFGTGRRESTGFPSGPGPTALLTRVRVGHHDHFDRVVFTFENRVPGYRVERTEPPIREDASGEEIEVAGDAFVAVRMSPASSVDLGGDELRETYTGPRRLPGPGEVVEVVRTGDFEALLTWVLGTRHADGFAVGTLTSPPRLVVDVRIP